MKKFLLTFLSILALGITTAAAQDDATVVSTKNYEENLIITINGDSSDKIPANITVDHMSDGTINFSLKNFKLVVGEQSMYVGNINLNGVLVEQKSGYEAISTTQTIQIVPGNEEGVKEEEWLGPMLGDVPIVLNGKIDDTHLYVNIDIDMRAAINQVINVVAGEADKVTGIANATKQEAATNSGVYTLSGVRVADALNAALPKGVYIVSGRKILK